MKLLYPDDGEQDKFGQKPQLVFVSRQTWKSIGEAWSPNLLFKRKLTSSTGEFHDSFWCSQLRVCPAHLFTDSRSSQARRKVFEEIQFAGRSWWRLPGSSLLIKLFSVLASLQLFWAFFPPPPPLTRRDNDVVCWRLHSTLRSTPSLSSYLNRLPLPSSPAMKLPKSEQTARHKPSRRTLHVGRAERVYSPR